MLRSERNYSFPRFIDYPYLELGLEDGNYSCK